MDSTDFESDEEEAAAAAAAAAVAAVATVEEAAAGIKIPDLTEERLDSLVKGIPKTPLQNLTQSDIKILQTSWKSFLTKRKLAEFSIEVFDEFFRDNKEYFPEEKKKVSATMFGNLMDLAIRNLGNQRLIARYVTIYQFERLRSSDVGVLFINEFAKFFKAKLLNIMSQEKNKKVETWAKLCDSIYQMANWQYLRLQHDFYDQELNFDAENCRTIVQVWRETIENISFNEFVDAIMDNLIEAYPEFLKILGSTSWAKKENVVEDDENDEEFLKQRLSRFIGGCMCTFDSIMDETFSGENLEQYLRKNFIVDGEPSTLAVHICSMISTSAMLSLREMSDDWDEKKALSFFKLFYNWTKIGERFVYEQTAEATTSAVARQWRSAADFGRLFAYLTPIEITNVSFLWRHAAQIGLTWSFQDMIFKKLFRKCPELMAKLTGDATMDIEEALKSERLNRHTAELIVHKEDIIAALFYYSSLQNKLVDFFIFLSSWDYSFQEVDAMLRLSYGAINMYLPFEDLDSVQQMGQHLHASWRKFYSMIGRKYKTFLRRTNQKEEDEEEEELKEEVDEDYDVGGPRETHSEFSTEEVKMLFSSWKMLEGATEDGIKYKNVSRDAGKVMAAATPVATGASVESSATAASAADDDDTRNKRVTWKRITRNSRERK